MTMMVDGIGVTSPPLFDGKTKEVIIVDDPAIPDGPPRCIRTKYRFPLTCARYRMVPARNDTVTPSGATTCHMGRPLGGASDVESGGGFGAGVRAGAGATSGVAADFGAGIGAEAAVISCAGDGSGTIIGAGAGVIFAAGGGSVTGIGAGASAFFGVVAGLGVGIGAGGCTTPLLAPFDGARGALRALGVRARVDNGAAFIRHTCLGGSSPAVTDGMRLAPSLMIGGAAGLLSLLEMAAVGGPPGGCRYLRWSG